MRIVSVGLLNPGEVFARIIPIVPTDRTAAPGALCVAPGALCEVIERPSPATMLIAEYRPNADGRCTLADTTETMPAGTRVLI